MSTPPKPTKSGEHPAVKGFRAKLDSVQDHTLEELLELNRALDAKIASIPPPRDTETALKDPRREAEDEDEDIPVDRIEWPTVPAPPPKKDER